MGSHEVHILWDQKEQALRNCGIKHNTENGDDWHN